MFSIWRFPGAPDDVVILVAILLDVSFGYSPDDPDVFFGRWSYWGRWGGVFGSFCISLLFFSFLK